MLRFSTLICLFLLPCLSQASQKSTLYQVDMIVFAHQQAAPQHTENSTTPVLPPDTQHAIYLQSSADATRAPYHILPTRSSQLNNEYWALNRKAEYQVIAHYTWLQPANNQRAIALPTTNHKGWNIEGTLRVRQCNFYLLDT